MQEKQHMHKLLNQMKLKHGLESVKPFGQKMDQDFSTAPEISYGTQSQMCLNINEVHNFQAFFLHKACFW